MFKHAMRTVGAAALLAAFAIGCGSDKGLPPATSTPEADQAAVKAGMDKSYEMMAQQAKQRGRKMGKPPGEN